MKTALIGAGAVGCYFVMGLYDKYGDDFMVVARGGRKERLEKKGLSINGRVYFPRIAEPEEVRKENIDFLIVSLKYTGLSGALDDIETCVSENTNVVSVLNGIDSEEIIGGRIGMEHIIYSMIKIASTRDGNTVTFPMPRGENMGVFIGERVRHGGENTNDAVSEGEKREESAGGTIGVNTGGTGEENTGKTGGGENADGTGEENGKISAGSEGKTVSAEDTDNPGSSERTRRFKELFDGTEVVCHISRDIEKDIWDKFGLNIARNLPQAVLGVGAGVYEDSAYIDDLSKKLRHEVVMLAAANGVEIGEEYFYTRAIPWQRYSTLQDLDAGRMTEIETFSGAHIRMAKKLGVPCPYNEVMYDLIKALEEKNEGKFNYRL